jgi:putative acetyltransferase
VRIERDDLTRPAVLALLEEHLTDMYEITPPGSVHALDVARLKGPNVTFWTIWDGETLLGCGALKELAPDHGEIKSMRTPKARRRNGAGRAVLAHIIDAARQRGYRRVSLETGATEHFGPAQRLYQNFGFVQCGPFGDYQADPHSVFMTLELSPAAHPDSARRAGPAGP